MSTNPDFTFGDDVMALADATGVNATPVHPEDLRNYRPHPAVRGELSDAGLEQVITAWSIAAAGGYLMSDPADIPIPYVVVDHGACDNPDCDAVVCMCTTPCAGLSERWCLHHNVLCEDCRLICPDCRDDYRQDGT